MRILTRMRVSLDGYVTTPDGWPVQVADPSWSPEAFGFVDFQKSLDAVLIGRTTFEPAIGADRWPWPGLDVFVLGSRRPEGTPDHIVVDSDPARLVELVREASKGGDIHLVGGPKTIEAFRQLGALDRLGLIVLPLLVGSGLQLTPAIDKDTALKLESERVLSTGAVELEYSLL